MADKRVHSAKLMEKGTGGNIYDEATKRPMMNVQIGGQKGFRSKYAGFDGVDRVIELHNDTKHQSSQVIAILMQYPKGFDYLPGAETWAESLKAIIEERAETITGLKGSLTATFHDSAVSGAGEKHSQVINMVRERSEVEFLYVDINTRPIQKLHTYWMEYLMMDPDVKVPKISALESYETDAWSTEYQSMSILFIETDPTARYVDRAWLGIAMMPKTNGVVEGRRNYEEDAKILELNIGYTGTYSQGQNVIELADSVLQTLYYLKSDTDKMPLAYEGRVDALNDTMLDTGFESADKDYQKKNS